MFRKEQLKFQIFSIINKKKKKKEFFLQYFSPKLKQQWKRRQKANELLSK